MSKSGAQFGDVFWRDDTLQVYSGWQVANSLMDLLLVDCWTLDSFLVTYPQKKTGNFKENGWLAQQI